MTAGSIGTARRWSMLVIALTTTLFANVFINGAAFLIPTLHIERGLDLAKAGLLSSMPSFGMVFTLIAWGYVVDRFGERIVLALGSALTAAAAFAAASVHSLVAVGAFLLLGGMAAASSNSASGRLVVGWFPPHQRGLTMGIRQTAQPLGVGLGALVIPRLAEHSGVAVSRRGAAGTPGQPVSGRIDAVANPCRVRAARRAAVRRLDVHPGLVDDRPR